MAYDLQLANRVRVYLADYTNKNVEEKTMFSGLALLVNDKMCINVSGDNLMCRFDPALQEEVAGKKGFEPMIMKGKQLDGYCFVNPSGLQSNKEFNYWMELSLEFNDRAKSSKKSEKKRPSSA